MKPKSSSTVYTEAKFCPKCKNKTVVPNAADESECRACKEKFRRVQAAVISGFRCPKCNNNTLFSVDKDVIRPADVEYKEHFVCDECGAELEAYPQHDGSIKFKEIVDSDVYGSTLTDGEFMKELQDDILDAAALYLQNNLGWDLNDVADMFFVNVEPAGDSFRVEVRCECDYDTQRYIAKVIDPVVQQRDDAAYFDDVDSGVMEAFVRKIQSSITAANYGGAYDVDPYQYFTRDEIVEFGEDVAAKFSNQVNGSFKLEDTYIVDYSRLVIEVTDDEYGYTAQVNIDMRRIRKPRDIYKYTDEALRQLIDQYASDHDNVDASTYIRSDTYKGLPDWWYEPDPEPEYNENYVVDEIDIDLNFDIEVDEYGDAAPGYDDPDYLKDIVDRWGVYHESEFEAPILGQETIDEDIWDLIEPHFPEEPGKYKVTGKVHLCYNVECILTETKYDQDEDGGYTYEELVEDQDFDVDLDKDKSKVVSVQFTKL